MINQKLQERVNNKRDIFLNKLKGLGLEKVQIDSVKELATSMEYANVNGENELASTYRDLIKKQILKYMSA